MDRDTIIDGLRMTMDLFTFDPTTGEEKDPDDLNDLDRATYDACKGALEILERLDAESDTISRVKAIEALDKRFDSIPMEQTSEILMLRKDLRELPPAQPEPYTDALKAEIKRMKRSFTICINSDYYTGYMSALSAVEGYIDRWR